MLRTGTGNKPGNDNRMDTAYARQQMIEQQIRTWDVFEERLLALFDRVERHRFVPDGWQRLAYAEAEIPIGHDEVMMRPSVEGRLLQALAVGPEDEVLEIGTGSGYLTACLASLGRGVVSVDIHEDFLTGAAKKLDAEGLDNVSLKLHDAGLEGPPPGRFDAIAVTGSLPAIDTRLLEALKPGGRLFVVLGNLPVMEARLYSRDASDSLRSEAYFETCLPRLRHVAEPSRFTF